jgi:tetratricopeptide (TPR) repeat protein
MAFAMWRFWQKRGHLNEARRRLEAIAAEPWSRDDPVLRARLMEALGGVLWWQADIAAMKVAYAEAVEIWRAQGDRAQVANALYNYAFAFSVNPDRIDDPTAADPDGEGARAQEEALALYEELGDVRGQANVLWGIGNSEYFHRSTDAGEARMRRAFDLFRQVGDTTMAAWSQHMLGGALLRLGRTEEARPILRDALRHFHGASDASALAIVLDDLASQAVADGDLPRAARIRGAARRLTAATGARLANFVDDIFEAGTRPHVSTMLSPEVLARYQAEGAAMTLDDVVAYALDEPQAEAGPHARDAG